MVTTRMFTQRGERLREASVSHFNKRHEFVSAVALLAACACSTSCTAWHTIPLQPQRFSADTSPDQVRVTLRDSTRFTASHPVLVGDSLVWLDRRGDEQHSAGRSASSRRGKYDRPPCLPGRRGGRAFLLLQPCCTGDWR